MLCLELNLFLRGVGRPFKNTRVHDIGCSYYLPSDRVQIDEEGYTSNNNKDSTINSTYDSKQDADWQGRTLLRIGYGHNGMTIYFFTRVQPYSLVIHATLRFSFLYFCAVGLAVRLYLISVFIYYILLLPFLLLVFPWAGS